jgi:anaerobic ribonucleoside-triphosphate reductase activating protein
MRIISTQYTLSQKSLDIYTAGCNAPHCKGCHNPETWNFNQGVEWSDDILYKIKIKTRNFCDIINNIMIFGGEPLDNPVNELVRFLDDLNTLNLDIWIFTRREFEEIPDWVKERCSYIKCGRYIEEKRVDNYFQYGIKLATSNQKIYKL